MQILLADDQYHIRSALKLLLAHEPELEVVAEAVTASDVLEAVGAHKIDTLILDWELPGLPARSLIQQLHKSYPRLAVLALSGKPEAQEEAQDVGVDAFVSKGHPPEILLGALQYLLYNGTDHNGVAQAA